MPPILDRTRATAPPIAAVQSQRLCFEKVLFVDEGNFQHGAHGHSKAFRDALDALVRAFEDDVDVTIALRVERPGERLDGLGE